MKRHHQKTMMAAGVLACAFAFIWTDTASAIQTTLGFARDWLVLGPYRRDNTGGNPGEANMRLDYITNGAAVTETSFVPSIDATVNTYYSVAASSAYLYRPGNGYPTPTVKYWLAPDDWININTDVYPPPPGLNNNNAIVYAWTWADNKTSAPLTCYVAVDRDDSIQILINGVEVGIMNAGGGNLGTNTTRNAWPVTLDPGSNLVMVKIFNGGGGYGWRLRFQSDGATGAATAANSLPRSQLEVGFTDYVSAMRRIPGVGIVSPGFPQAVQIVLSDRWGASPTPTVIEVPPAGGTVSSISATLGTATFAGGRITWTIPAMTDDVATMTYQTTVVGNSYCSGTLTVPTGSWPLVSGAVGGDNLIWTPNPLGDFDAEGLVGYPPLGVPPGDPSTSGSVSCAGGVYTLTASGGDFAGPVDRGRMLVKRMAATSFIVDADVQWTSTVSDAWCKTGLDIRACVSGDAPGVWAGLRNLINPSNGQPQSPAVMEWRNTRYAERGTAPAVQTNTTPCKIRLVRNGNVIDAFHFFNGVWNRLPGAPHPVADLSATSEVLLCYFVSSHVNGVDAVAQMSALTTNSLPVLSAIRRITPTLFTSQPLTVSIGLRCGSSSSTIKVTDVVPAGWTISNPVPTTGTVINGTTITWTLTSFTADTTLTYTVMPAPFLFPAVLNGYTEDQHGVQVIVEGDQTVLAAGVYLFQQGAYPTAAYAGCSDAHLVQWYNGVRNNGNSTYLETGNDQTANTDNKIPLVRFALAGITRDSVVDQARVRIYHWRNRNPQNMPPGMVHPLYASRLLRDWTEGAGGDGDGRNAVNGEVNWYWVRHGQERWEMAGARGPTDMAAPESLAQVSTSTLNTWIEFDVTQMVREWARNPQSNFGLKLAEDNAVGTSATLWARGFPGFRSRDYGNPSFRPMLAIRGYVPPVLGATRWELFR